MRDRFRSPGARAGPARSTRAVLRQRGQGRDTVRSVVGRRRRRAQGVADLCDATQAFPRDDGHRDLPRWLPAQRNHDERRCRRFRAQRQRPPQCAGGRPSSRARRVTELPARALARSALRRSPRLAAGGSRTASARGASCMHHRGEDGGRPRVWPSVNRGARVAHRRGPVSRAPMGPPHDRPVSIGTPDGGPARVRARPEVARRTTRRGAWRRACATGARDPRSRPCA